MTSGFSSCNGKQCVFIIIKTNLSEKSTSDEPEAVVDRELVLHNIILDNTERKDDGEKLAGGMKTTIPAKEKELLLCGG